MWFLLILFSPIVSGNSMINAHFVQLIEKIHQEQPDPTGAFDLGQSATFCELYANSNRYVADVLKYLEYQATSEKNQFIAVSLMHNLSLSSFMNYSWKLLALQQKGKISKKMFDIGILPGFELSTTLVENYQDPEVQRFLQAIINSSAIDEKRKVHINNILTGKAFKNYLEYVPNGKMGCK